MYEVRVDLSAQEQRVCQQLREEAFVRREAQRGRVREGPHHARDRLCERFSTVTANAPQMEKKNQKTEVAICTRSKIAMRAQYQRGLVRA